MNEEQIARVLEILNQSGQATVAHYAAWHFASAMVWIMVGVAFLALATIPIALKKRIDKSGDFDFVVVIICFSGPAVLLGLLFIGGNLADLIEPQAAAIHQLISDIRRG